MIDTNSPQFKILVGMLSMQAEDGSILPNPFYGASVERVEAELEKAREVYEMVFAKFTSSWCLRVGRRLGIPDSVVPDAVLRGVIKLPPAEWRYLEGV